VWFLFVLFLPVNRSHQLPSSRRGDKMATRPHGGRRAGIRLHDPNRLPPPAAPLTSSRSSSTCATVVALTTDEFEKQENLCSCANPLDRRSESGNRPASSVLRRQVVGRDPVPFVWPGGARRGPRAFVCTESQPSSWDQSCRRTVLPAITHRGCSRRWRPPRRRWPQRLRPAGVRAHGWSPSPARKLTSESNERPEDRPPQKLSTLSAVDNPRG